MKAWDLGPWRDICQRLLTQNHCNVEMKHEQRQGAEDGAQAVAGCSLSQR